MEKNLGFVTKAFTDFGKSFEILHGDVGELLNLSNTVPRDFWLRMWVRTFFSYVEGTCYGLRQITFAYFPFNPCLTMAELHLLTESSYELSESGEAKERHKYLDSLAGIKFTFKLVGKVFDPQSETEFSGPGWTSFQTAMKIRNAITHPKNAEALKLYDSNAVFDNKFQQVMNAYMWYDKKLSRAMAAIDAALQAAMPTYESE